MSAVEFQAVIMAGGLGNRMYPLTSGHPKCMLPLVNRPLLSYQIEILERSGFANAIVVIQNSDKEVVQQFLADEYKGNINVDLVTLSEPMGTADAFRQPQLCEKIKTDFFVMSGDLVTNVFLHYLADIHRSRDSALTVLLTRSPVDKSKDAKKKRDSDDMLDKHYIGLDDSDSKNRLLMFASASDIEDELEMSKATLRRHPNLTVYNNLVDCHLYIMSPWVLKLIEEKKNISSIQAELIPYLVSHQFSEKVDGLLGDSTSSEHEKLAQYMSHSSSEHPKDERFRCFALMAQRTSFCKRANTVQSFERMSKALASTVWEYTPWSPVRDGNDLLAAREANQKAQIGPQCVVGRGLVCGENTSIKKSVVGQKVVIKGNSRIVNSIIFDNAIIDDGVTLQGCVIGRGAHITKGSTMKDCRVGHGAVTATGGLEFKNETITLDNQT